MKRGAGRPRVWRPLAGKSSAQQDRVPIEEKAETGPRAVCLAALRVLG